MKFKIIFLFSMLIVIFFCNGCRKKQDYSKIITLNLQEGDLPSLNPCVGIDLRSRCLLLALFEPLMRRNHEGQLELAAAQKVEIDPTHTIYTFHIRPHKWSNGEVVTSYHFEQAWKYALKPTSSCFRSDLFYPIKNAEIIKKGDLDENCLGVTTPDAETLIVTLEHPTPYFLDLTASSFYSPLYSPSDKEPCYFNGPFIIKQWIPDQKLIFKKNPLYWDIDSVHLDEICFTMIKDPMTAFAMYEKAELDLVGDPLSPLPFDLIPSLTESQSLQKKAISRIFYLLLNTETYPLHNKSLRKALSVSIDRQQLTQHLFFGEIPTQSPLPSTLTMLTALPIEQSSDVLFEEALRELQISRDTFPKLVLSYAELSGQKKLAEFIQAQLREKLNIEIELVCQEWNTHSSHLRKGSYQIGTLHLTTLYQDPMFYFDLFKKKQSISNYCRWENEHFRYLLEQSENTFDSQLRQTYLQQAELHLLEEMPVIALFTQNLQYLINKRLDLKLSDLGIYDFKHANFIADIVL